MALKNCIGDIWHGIDSVGMNLKTTDINRLFETLGIKALFEGK
jgi:hypothetical protein